MLESSIHKLLLPAAENPQDAGQGHINVWQPNVGELDGDAAAVDVKVAVEEDEVRRVVVRTVVVIGVLRRKLPLHSHGSRRVAEVADC